MQKQQPGAGLGGDGGVPLLRIDEHQVVGFQTADLGVAVDVHRPTENRQQFIGAVPVELEETRLIDIGFHIHRGGLCAQLDLHVLFGGVGLVQHDFPSPLSLFRSYSLTYMVRLDFTMPGNQADQEEML